MAVTQLTPQIIDGSVEQALAAANADGSYFEVPDTVTPWRMFLRAKNAHTGAQGVTVTAQRADSQGNLNDNEVSVPADTGDVIIPIRPWEVDDAGKVHLEFPDGVTSLTIGVFQLHKTALVD
jgi:hypothetical protein